MVVGSGPTTSLNETRGIERERERELWIEFGATSDLDSVTEQSRAPLLRRFEHSPITSGGSGLVERGNALWGCQIGPSLSITPGQWPKKSSNIVPSPPLVDIFTTFSLVDVCFWHPFATRGKCRCSNPRLTKEQAATSYFVLLGSSDFVSTRTSRTKRCNEVVTRNGDSLFYWKRHRLDESADVGQKSIPPLLPDEPGFLGNHVASSLDQEICGLLRCREGHLQPLDGIRRLWRAPSSPRESASPHLLGGPELAGGGGRYGERVGPMVGMKLPGTHDARTTRPEGTTARASSLMATSWSAAYMTPKTERTADAD